MSRQHRSFHASGPHLDVDPTDPTSPTSFPARLAAMTGLSGLDTPLATGSLALTAMAGTLAAAKVLGDMLIELIKKRILVRADIDSRDDAYAWMLAWLAESLQRDCRHVSVSTRVSLTMTSAHAAEEAAVTAAATGHRPVYFFPALGLHFFWYRNRLFWATRTRAQPTSGVVSGGAAPAETLRLTTFGRDRRIIEHLVHDAQSLHLARDKSRTQVLTGDQYGVWRRVYSRPARPLASVVLDARVKRDLVADARAFLASEQWYAETGIPYRRGYLLHGPPGTGKTSLVAALAGHLQLNVYVLNLASKALNDANVLELLIDAPPRCILLLEDIHALFQPPADPIDQTAAELTSGPLENGGYKYTRPSLTSNISFSTLLNILDGVTASEGRLLIMTCNTTEHLDPALLRPGRVDRHVYLGNASPAMAATLAARFFPTADDKVPAALARALADQIARDGFAAPANPHLATAPASAPVVEGDEDMGPANLPVEDTLAVARAAVALSHVRDDLVHAESRVSPAQLVQYLMRFRHDPAAAVANVAQLVAMGGGSGAPAPAQGADGRVEEDAVASGGMRQRKVVGAGESDAE
ncbi:mitochondrial chaperone [Allomyces arbusculus]|nr:mitochondrial chaperone [Allomyces arbusculus]